MTKRLALWLLATVIINGMLVALAGRADVPGIWMFGGGFSFHLLLAALLVSPEHVEERFKFKPTADPPVLFLVRVLAFTTFVVAAVDAGRYRALGAVPLPVSIAALALMMAALFLALAAVRANKFFVPAMRIQTERGHHVVDRGPYRYIRHPGYAAMLVIGPASALVIGSWAALVPGVLTAAAFAYRARREDQFLMQNLEGYTEYATRTRFRLVPGLW